MSTQHYVEWIKEVTKNEVKVVYGNGRVKNILIAILVSGLCAFLLITLVLIGCFIKRNKEQCWIT